VIDMLRSKHPIGLLCRVAHVFPSGYYAWRKNAPKRKKKDEEDHILADTIQTSCGKKLGKEGYRQVSMRFKGTHNHKKIARVMKQHGLQAKIRRADPYKKIHRDGGEHSIAPNILKRAFDHTILWPHRVFGTDITYIRVADGRGWAYLSTVKDLCSGEIVAHALSMHPDTDLVLATLDPLAALAFADKVKLGELLADVSTTEVALQQMLAEFAEKNGLDWGAAKPDAPEPEIDRAAENRRKRLKGGL